MNAIGKNATMITAGDWSPRPPTAAMKPSVAARLYAGATDATLITMFETNEIAFFLRPLSSTCELLTAGATVALSTGSLLLAARW